MTLKRLERFERFERLERAWLVYTRRAWQKSRLLLLHLCDSKLLTKRFERSIAVERLERIELPTLLDSG
jgi:hypothetical protein